MESGIAPHKHEKADEWCTATSPHGTRFRYNSKGESEVIAPPKITWTHGTLDTGREFWVNLDTNKIVFEKPQEYAQSAEAHEMPGKETVAKPAFTMPPPPPPSMPPPPSTPPPPPMPTATILKDKLIEANAWKTALAQ